MAATDKILARKEGRVGTLVFNNPERHNAVSLEMWEAAARVLEEFAKDAEVRVLVVTGAGGKAFVSGADISKFEDERATEAAVERYNATSQGFYAGLKRFFDTIGPSNTKDIFFSARQFGAAEALSMGVVNKALPDAELATFVQDYANTIAENAPLTINAIKQIAIEALKPESERDLELAAGLVARCFSSQDYIEGRNAFMQKRKPVFTGK